jgi:hypothetical protein
MFVSIGYEDIPQWGRESIISAEGNIDENGSLAGGIRKNHLQMLERQLGYAETETCLVHPGLLKPAYGSELEALENSNSKRSVRQHEKANESLNRKGSLCGP